MRDMLEFDLRQKTKIVNERRSAGELVPIFNRKVKLRIACGGSGPYFRLHRTWCAGRRYELPPQYGNQALTHAVTIHLWITQTPTRLQSASQNWRKLLSG